MFSERHIEMKKEKKKIKVTKDAKFEQCWNKANTLWWNVSVHLLNIVAVLDITEKNFKKWKPCKKKKKKKKNSFPTFHLINFKKDDGLMMQ